jgi:hypothetical protein
MIDLEQIRDEPVRSAIPRASLITAPPPRSARSRDARMSRCVRHQTCISGVTAGSARTGEIRETSPSAESPFVVQLR